MPSETRVKLWEAINLYARACGGKPSEHVHGNNARETAVVAIESLIELERFEARSEAFNGK